MAEPIAGYVLCLTWLSVGACAVFVAVTECEVRLRTHRQTVLINTNFLPRVQHPRLFCTTITSGSVLHLLERYSHVQWRQVLLCTCMYPLSFKGQVVNSQLLQVNIVASML